MVLIIGKENNKMTILEELANGAASNTNHIDTLVTETHFTRDELQNPNTIRKILESKNYFANIAKYLIALTGIVSVVASIPFIGIPTLFMGPLGIGVLFGYIYTAIDAYPIKRKEKQLKQLQDQCLTLSIKMEQACHKNPDKESTYREIIKNCNKVSDAVDTYYKKTKDKQFMDEIDDAMRIYQKLIQWLKKPHVFEETELFGMFYLAELLGIRENTVVSYLAKGGKPTCNLQRDWFSGQDIPSNLMTIVPELEDSSFIYEIYINDDSGLWYSPKAHSFISNEDGTFSLKRVSLYSFIKEYKDLYPSKEAFIEADKNLGYYQLSKCPKSVHKKPLNLSNNGGGNMKTVLELLASGYQVEENYDSLLESAFNHSNMLMEGLFGDKTPEPPQWLDEIEKLQKALLKLSIKPIDEKKTKKYEEKLRKMKSKGGRHYHFGLATDNPSKCPQVIKSLGYKQGEFYDEPKTGDKVHYFIKEIGEFVIDVICSTTENKKELERGKDNAVIVMQLVPKSKIKDPSVLEKFK